MVFRRSTKPTLQRLKEKTSGHDLVGSRFEALGYLRAHNPSDRGAIVRAVRISLLLEEDGLNYKVEHILLLATP